MHNYVYHVSEDNWFKTASKKCKPRRQSRFPPAPLLAAKHQEFEIIVCVHFRQTQQQITIFTMFVHKCKNATTPEFLSRSNFLILQYNNYNNG